MNATLKKSDKRFRLYEVTTETDPNVERTFMVAINQDRMTDKWFYTITNVSGGGYDKNRYPTRLKELADELTLVLNNGRHSE